MTQPAADSNATATKTAETAFAAYREFLGTDPAKIDAIVEAMAKAIEPEAQRLAEMAVEETGCGNVHDKTVKNMLNIVSVAKHLRKTKTLGLLSEDKEAKVATYAVPMGVVVGLIPLTNPTSTVIFKIMSSVKSGNAIVCSPHPKGIKCGVETARIMAEAAEAAGAPKGLVQCLDVATRDVTEALMRHPKTSVVMATGGQGMIKKAYLSGKPTLAVGAGNVPCYVHKSKEDELEEIIDMVLLSKCFDNGTACVAEQAIVADTEVAGELRRHLADKGAHFCSADESNKLGHALFKDERTINPELVGQTPAKLAEAAGFSVPEKTRALVSEETEVGWHRPLSAEKLNPVLAFYEVRDSDEGIKVARSIAEFGGWGHTAVVHTHDSGVIDRFSEIPVGRVLVNTPSLIGASGYSTSLDPSFTLGTGTWSGSITTDNVTASHLVNIKRVARPTLSWHGIFDDRSEAEHESAPV